MSSANDPMPTKERSLLMARVRQRDTKPEMLVRRAIHGIGYRFRLQRRDLPGSPDIVLPKHKLAIFVHGCFWHRHPGCRLASTPKTRVNFWASKFVANIARDERAIEELQRLGWRVAVIWECETRSPCLKEALEQLILDPRAASLSRG